MSRLGFSPRRYQGGISFVEVLVAMVIGVIILAGVMQSMLTNQRNTAWSDDVAFVQENARYALERLARDIRWSGYWGCAANMSMAGDGDTTFENTVDVPADHNWLRLEGVQGYEGSDEDSFPEEMASGAALWSANANFAGNDDFAPDAVIFRGADPAADLVVTDLSNSADFVTNRDTTLEAGDIAVAVSNLCRNVDLMEVSAANNNSFTVDPPLPNAAAFGIGSTVMQFDAVAYYIGESVADASQPALYRAQYASKTDDDVTVVTDEIAVGVEDMQLLYGVDTDEDSLANAYLRADEIDADAGEWRQVVSVKIMLLMRGFGDTREGDGEVTYVGYPYSGDDDTYDGQAYNDTVLRQQVSKTVRIRNIGAG